MRLTRGLGPVLATALIACGGAKTTATPAPASAEPTPAQTSAPATEEVAEEPGAGTDAGLSADDRALMEERRANFVSVCNQSGNNGAYCSCTWDQLLEVVSREEILADKTSKEQVDELRRRALLHCVDDIPEETVKKGFLGGCEAKANPAFCTCAYRELRKRVSTREIATRGGEDRDGFVSQRNEALEACVGQVDAAAVKENFVRGCRDNGGAKASCLCAWNYVRGKVDLMDIALDRIDTEKLGPGLRQACRKPAP